MDYTHLLHDAEQPLAAWAVTLKSVRMLRDKQKEAEAGLKSLKHAPSATPFRTAVYPL